LAKAEQWIAGHEARCEERYAALQAAVEGLHAALEGWRRGAWALVLAVLGLAVTIIGSLLIQVYDLEPLRAHATDPTATPTAEAREGGVFR
jgi:hypothetical protein